MSQLNNSLPYDPNRLLDTLSQRLGLDSDAALARMLLVSSQMIVSMRAGLLPVPPSILLAMAECAGASIDELRCIMGDRRRKARMSCGVLAA